MMIRRGRERIIRLTKCLTATARTTATAVDRIRPPQSASFYLSQDQQRTYYYVLDTRGQLHLEAQKYRNFTSCFKDKQFLSFFFKQLRPNVDDVLRREELDSYAQLCPYVSLCGNERNFVTPEDPLSAIVFVDFDDTTGEFIYPGVVAKERLDPSRLAMSSTTGRLYHPVTALPRLAATNETGLLHPALCQRFTEKVFSDPETGSLYIAWNDGQNYRLSMLE